MIYIYFVGKGGAGLNRTGLPDHDFSCPCYSTISTILLFSL